MKIIIVGCGKVGKNIAAELIKEGHDIVVIDNNASLVQEVADNLDVLGVVGNGASINLLKEAGVEDADMLLAMTSADEVNMLCCLFARKANKNCKTIARVRDPLYNEEINYIKDELGLTMAMNPEMISAKEISRLVRWPKALKVDSFGNDRLELISFAVEDNKYLVDKSIKDIMSVYKDDILFVGIERKDEAIIPNGSTVIKAGDKVSVFATPEVTTRFLNRIGIYQSPIKNCLIAGGSTIAYYLSQILDEHHIDVCIIDKNDDRCRELASLLPNASIIHGYASDDNLLVEEGLPDADCFCSLTGVDEENVLLSLYARSISKAKVITKVNHISYEGVINGLDVGALISPKLLTADHIVSYVRAISNAGDNDIETMHHILNNKAEALSFRINKKSNVTGVPFENLNLKDNLLICSIIRNNNLITPSGKTCLEVGDLVMVVTTNCGLAKIEDVVKK